MLKVHVKTNQNFKLTLPVPYSLLSFGIRLAGSKTLWNLTIKRAGQSTSSDWTTYLPKDPTVLKHHLRPVLKEIRSLKGHKLVDVQTKDGTCVKITC